MITLTILAVFIFMMAIYLIAGLFTEFGLALFVIADIAIAVKFLCWLFKPKNKNNKIE